MTSNTAAIANMCHDLSNLVFPTGKVNYRLRPNKGLQRTALCAHKIAAILKAGIRPTAFPIYECAAAEAQTVGPLS